MHSLDLSAILGPIPANLFLARHFGKTMLHLPGPPDRFAPLAAGPDAGPSPGRIDETHAAARLLAERLERALEAGIQVHLATGGISRHRCERDLLLLQVEGEAHWSAETPSGQPSWSAAAAAGDALYLPRDWWCASESPAGRAWRVIIENPTGADLVEWLAGWLKNNQAIRLDLPRFAGPGEQADYVNSIRRPFMRALRAPGLLERYTRYLHYTAQRETAPGVGWSQSLSTDHWIVLGGVRRLQVHLLDPQTIFIVWRGEQVMFPGEASQMLQFLDEEAPVTIQRFHETFEREFDREELADSLSVLSAKGIIVLREPDEHHA
jgi:hypothetical protein